MQEAKAYETDQNLMEAAKAEAALIAGNWNMVAKNGSISGYDKETGKFTFSEGTNDCHRPGQACGRYGGGRSQ
ncbi:MAG: hypothetical protein ACLUOI_23100 [Eisenbergiella sp.]